MIKGERIELLPAALDDRRSAYQWGYQSDITHCHMGPPDYPDHQIPTWEEFCDDYVDYYFNGTEPAKGQCFMIVANGEKVGVISYACFHLNPGKAELDIWMSCEANCGKGYGSDAIKALCRYLNEQCGIDAFIIRPSERNKRAVRAYEKSGFMRIDPAEKEKAVKEFLLEEYLERYGGGDYGNGDDVVLVKTM